MEAEELAIVLSRASDLHIKISDAIERSIKTQRANAGADSPSTVLDTSAVSSENSASGSPKFADFGQGDVLSDSKPWQGPSREARSLVAIREALETLEVQLEDLQKLQQVQLQERENALAELEESRRMLLRRLREHQGREWEVVNEALAFAGEPVEDLAEDEDDFDEEDEDYVEDEEESADENEDEEFIGTPEIGENTVPEEEHTPVTPPGEFLDVLQGDPVSNLEASLDQVADEEETFEEEEGSGFMGGFGRALLKVAGGALAVAAALVAYDASKVKGVQPKSPQGKPPTAMPLNRALNQEKSSSGSARGNAPTATLSNRALNREKSGFGSARDNMPLCTVRERTVSPVKKGRSPDVLLARG